MLEIKPNLVCSYIIYSLYDIDYIIYSLYDIDYIIVVYRKDIYIYIRV